MIFKKISILVFTFILAVTLCAESDSEFVFGMSDVSINYNPIHAYSVSEAQLFTAIYEGLVSYHPYSMEPVPGVAKSWEISDDKLRYTFHLRDAYFWNGDPVTAKDFYESWKIFLDPEEEAEYSFLFDVIKNAEAYRTGEINDFSEVGIRVISDSVLEVELEKPAGHFLKVLCHHAFVPLHPAFRESDDWPEDKPQIGNGAFYIVDQTDEFIQMEKNKLYWDEASVEIDSLKILKLSDPLEATQAYNRGEIHWLVDQFNFQLIEDPFSLVLAQMFASAYFFFNCDLEAYSDADVRKALSGVLPWDEIRSDQYMYLPSAQLVPEIPYYPEVEIPRTYTVQEAKALLAKSGYSDTSKLPPISILVPGGDYTRIAEIMKESWESNFDIKVEIREVPRNYLEALHSEDYTLAITSWIGDFADPLAFLQMWTSGNNLNEARYANKAFDELIFEAMEEDMMTRYALYAEAETLLLKDAAVLPLRHDPSVNIINTNKIGGWYANPLDIHPFKYFVLNNVNIPPNVTMLDN